MQHNNEEYIKFAEAAKMLGVRFQQVFQRAVVRNKMKWIEQGKAKYVRLKDVQEWAQIRKEYFK